MTLNTLQVAFQGSVPIRMNFHGGTEDGTHMTEVCCCLMAGGSRSLCLCIIMGLDSDARDLLGLLSGLVWGMIGDGGHRICHGRVRGINECVTLC